MEHESPLVVEISGASVVIRASARVDWKYTVSLADVINAATDTDTCVVVDFEAIRGGITCASLDRSDVDRFCSAHPSCRPHGVEVVAPGIVRCQADGAVWLIDVRDARLCQADADIDRRFLGHGAWEPIVAFCATPTRLIALGTDGTQKSARRAHRVPMVASVGPGTDRRRRWSCRPEPLAV